MAFDDAFDAVVFFDALHHAVDERAAVGAAYRALRPGGVCVTAEPGRGHAGAADSVAAVRRFGVTERDMPPARVIAAGRAAGFRRFRVYPHGSHLGQFTYNYAGGSLRPLVGRWPWLGRLGSFCWVVRLLLTGKWHSGLVVMGK
jgi:SAM-dependent methyltransferase